MKRNYLLNGNVIVTLLILSTPVCFVKAAEYDATRWTNVSIYNSGGYTSWYEAEWYDSKSGVTKSKKTGTNTAGYTHAFEFPPYARDIRVKGYTLTGLVWSPNKLIFDRYIGDGDVFDELDAFGDGQYFKIKIWGTTLSPKWAQTSTSLTGLDPYSPNPYQCSGIRVSYYGNYPVLLSPVRYQVDLINDCRFTTKITLIKSDNSKKSYIIKSKQTLTNYEFAHPHIDSEHTEIGTRDHVRVFEQSDFGGARFDFDSSQPTLPAAISGKISSYAIPYGWKVRFYESENYRGRYWTRTSGSSDHNIVSDFNDIVKSIEVLERP